MWKEIEVFRLTREGVVQADNGWGEKHISTNGYWVELRH